MKYSIVFSVFHARKIFDLRKDFYFFFSPVYSIVIEVKLSYVYFLTEEKKYKSYVLCFIHRREK